MSARSQALAASRVFLLCASQRSLRLCVILNAFSFFLLSSPLLSSPPRFRARIYPIHPSINSSEAFTTMRFTRFAASAAALFFISAIPSFSQTSTTPPPGKPKSTTTAPKPAASPYDRTLLKPSLLKDQAPDTFQVKFETTRGDFTVTVTRAWAPFGADRFYNLVKHHYYDGARVYRVIPGFVAQFGISAYPPVNAAWQTATIKDDPVTQKNKRGTLTFAKTANPNARTTEIFIN